MQLQCTTASNISKWHPAYVALSSLQMQLHLNSNGLGTCLPCTCPHFDKGTQNHTAHTFIEVFGCFVNSVYQAGHLRPPHLQLAGYGELTTCLFNTGTQQNHSLYTTKPHTALMGPLELDSTTITPSSQSSNTAHTLANIAALQSLNTCITTAMHNQPAQTRAAAAAE